MRKLFIFAVVLVSANLLFSLQTTLIPAEALLRVEVNVKKLLSSEYYKEFKASPKGKQAMAKFEKVKNLLGIDPEKSVNFIELYAAKPRSPKDKLMLFYVSTNLKNSRIKALIQAETEKKKSKLEELEVKGFETLKVTPVNKDVGYVIFLEEGKIAVSSEGWLEEAVMNYKGEKVVNKKLSSVEPRSKDMMINAALIIPDALKAQMAKKPPAAPFSKVDMMYLGINSEKKEIELNILLRCLNVEDATTISNGLNGFMMMGRMFLQQKNLAEVLDYLNISLVKEAVNINLKMNELELKTIAEKLKALTPPGMMPMGKGTNLKKSAEPVKDAEK